MEKRKEYYYTIILNYYYEYNTATNSNKRINHYKLKKSLSYEKYLCHFYAFLYGNS